MSTPKPNVFTKERIAELKKKYDPDLVDALLTHAEDADLEAIWEQVLQTLLARGAGDARFDDLAVERRKQEAGIIKEEVAIFGEMGKLMSSINERYRSLAGLAPRQGR